MHGASRRHPRLRIAALVIGAVLGVVIVLVLALALIPESPGDVASHPNPAPDYATAVERFDAIAAKEQQGVFAPCKSRLLTHGSQTEVSVVLFHGWSNCPRQFLEFGQQLYDQGANVLILREPHHGLADASGKHIGSINTLGGITAEGLRQYTEQSVDIADGLGRERRVLGLSMGGILAAWVAQNRPDVERVVAVAPALQLAAIPGFANPLFANAFGRLPNISIAGSDPTTLKHQYNGTSTHSLASMLLLGRAVREQAAATAPAVKTIAVDTNDNDDVIVNSAADQLAADWSAHGATVTTFVFPKSDDLAHDVIDVQNAHANPGLVYPILLKQLGFG
jgi:alpha-beta hydrolase superfamily lysophospholipase